MKRLSQYLTDLIILIEDIVRQPATPMPASFAALATEIRRAHALPAEGIRCTHSAAAATELIEGLYYVSRADAQTRAPWLMLIGAALPLLRAEAYQAFCNEREARDCAR
jgi:hypothetical protein